MQQPVDSPEKLYDVTAETLQPRSRSVLILEDDLGLGQIIGLFLADQSFEVVTVSSGAEGLRHIIERNFDVIVCDLNMPALSGDMLYLAVDRVRKDLTKRFVFITGCAEDPRWVGFLAKVTNPILEKPFALPELLSTIQTLLTALELGAA